jgi:dipeptidyl aminopeptidase/acylaminoacyl peptidase
MRTCVRLIAATLCLALAGAAVAQPGKPKKLRLEMLLDLEGVSTPLLSPDGKHIVFTRSWVNKMEDKKQSDLWIMNADGSRQRFLTEGGGAVWSPDGTRLAFLRAGKPSGSQVHVLWLDTREVTQITRVTQAPSALRWSPDGKRISFNMRVPEKEGFAIKMPPAPKGAKWAPEPKVITRLTYRRDQLGYHPTGYSHLFVVDSTGGTPRQVTSGNFDHGAGQWTPDGSELVFSGLREKDADWQVRESEIYAVNVASGAVRQLTRRKGPDFGPSVSPDGKYVAYIGHDATKDTYEVPKIHVIDIKGGKPRVLAASLDRRPTGRGANPLLWAKDSKSLYLSVPSEGRVQAYNVTLDDKLTKLTDGVHQFGVTDVGKDGTLVGVLTDPHRPGDVWLRSVKGTMHQLTRVNDDVLEGVKLGKVEEIKYKSKDGLEIQGWVVFPPDFDPNRKYPLILQIHGGPHAMYGVDFSFERQDHAANGYILLYTNPRGSDGYGKKFGNAINNAYPDKDFDDLMAGVDAVIQRGYVDEHNLFVYGGSGGGVLTCWTVGHTKRFRAAVSMFPVTNWVSFVGTTDGPYWYTNFKKLPWEDIDEHWRRSPLRYVGNVTTPTMLITGELDLRTPMAQTEEYYQALKLRKVDTVMVRVPNEYHGAAGRHVSNALRRILYVRGWFDKYRTKGPSVAGAASADKR